MDVIYAIGDIHGEASRLEALHAEILALHRQEFAHLGLTIIHLGDYVDRGPDSARVLDLLIGLEGRSDLTCVNLKGNHEAMMLDGVTDSAPGARTFWLTYGGEETLASYRRRGRGGVDKAHLDWLSTLSPIHIESERKMIFVHAGIDPATYPSNTEKTYMWTRSRRFFDVDVWENADLAGWTIVHGHTPTGDGAPEVQTDMSTRINLDTGACAGGALTAAIFAPGEPTRFISA